MKIRCRCAVCTWQGHIGFSARCAACPWWLYCPHAPRAVCRPSPWPNHAAACLARQLVPGGRETLRHGQELGHALPCPGTSAPGAHQQPVAAHLVAGCSAKLWALPSMLSKSLEGVGVSVGVAWAWACVWVCVWASASAWRGRVCELELGSAESLPPQQGTRAILKIIRGRGRVRVGAGALRHRHNKGTRTAVNTRHARPHA